MRIFSEKLNRRILRPTKEEKQLSLILEVICVNLSNIHVSLFIFLHFFTFMSEPCRATI